MGGTEICGSARDRQSGVRDWDHRRSVRREDRRGLGVTRPSQVSPIFYFCPHCLSNLVTSLVLPNLPQHSVP